MGLKYGIACCLLLMTPAFAAADTLIVCWESGLKPPYLELDEKRQPVGIMVERLELILDEAGLSYQHILLPWGRCLQAVAEGKADLVPNASYKTERASYAHYSDPAYSSQLALYYSQLRFPEPPQINDIEELKLFRVGGMIGFNYSFYEDQMELHSLVRRRAQLIEMLKRERIDFAVLQKAVVDALTKRGELDLNTIASIPEPVHPEKHYHILVSKQTPNATALVDTINLGLKSHP